MLKTTAVYFTRVDLGRIDNGGGLACRNHVRRIAETDGVDLTVCCTGPQADTTNTSDFVNSVGAKYEPIAFTDGVAQPILRSGTMMYELEARSQRHIDATFCGILDRLNPDVLVVDYLYSALYIPSAYRRKALRRITITLNREVEYAREIRQWEHLPPLSKFSELRLKQFEQTTYLRSHSVVALTKRDLPLWPKPGQTVISPVFDPAERRWTGENSDNIFFIGNINHYPNKQSVEWIICHLAPALRDLGSKAVIDIIGASAEQLSYLSIPPNVRCHGTASRAEAVQHFIACGMFIAPIENEFGSKMKLLDCLSFGTPFAATQSALSGLPFINDVPLILLDDPAQTARTLDKTLTDAGKRRSLSLGLSARLQNLLVKQSRGWRHVLYNAARGIHSAEANPQDSATMLVNTAAGDAGDAEQDSARHWLSLANSHSAAGRIKDAADAYATTSAIGGADEDVWYACLQEARCLRALEDESGFLRAALAAFNQCPQRAEPLYDLAHYYRERGMNDASVLFSEPGLAIPRPSNDTPHLEDFVYTTGLREEYSIAANYARDKARKDRGHTTCEWLALRRESPEHSRDLARRNLVFYAHSLDQLAPSFTAHKIAFTPSLGWSACNPGLARWGDDIWCVIRSSNHTLHDDGSFTAPPGEHVRTQNYLARLNENLDPVSVNEISLPTDWPAPSSLRAQGFEDCRLFVWRDHLWISATVSELTPEGWCEIALARIEHPADNPRLADWRVLAPVGPKRNEKNWMPWVDGDMLQFIYRIDPGRIIGDKAQIACETNPALALDHLRGGSPLLAFDGGWLTVTHEVAILGSGARRYLHRWVWFGGNGIVRRVSAAFYLLKCEYEYVGGLLWHADKTRLVMCFGRWDREAWVSTVLASEVRKMLIFMPGAQGPASTDDIAAFVTAETNHALRTNAAVDGAVALADVLGWPPHPTRYKVWDNLLAVGHALTLPLDAAILDAGSERDSPFLGVLHRHGYHNLTGINLLFTRPEWHDGIMYRQGDITATDFGRNQFDYVACLSVIEHGVDVAAFLSEMARILAPDGLLFVSFDYWVDPVETGDLMAYGAPVYIFTRQDAEALIDAASRVGLTVVGEIDLRCHEKVVHWDGLEYTFANLLFRQAAEPVPYATD